MKHLFTLLFFAFLTTNYSQISNFSLNDEMTIGLGLSHVKIDNSTSVYLPLKEVKYFSLSVDIVKYNFEQWGFKYSLDFKWATDLLYKAKELWGGTGLDVRPDFSGITAHKLGINVLATDYFCIGLGGSFSDYIVDLPKWNSNGNFDPGINWQEPSGWHWTAGPALFFDAGYEDFVITFTASYDYTYLRPVISKDYENSVDKINGYAPTNFFFFDITIIHNSGLFISFDRTKMIDNGINKNVLIRNDFQLGYKF